MDMKELIEIMEKMAQENGPKDRREEIRNQEAILCLQETLQEELDGQKGDVLIVGSNTQKKINLLRALRGLGFRTNINRDPMDLAPIMEDEASFIVLVYQEFSQSFEVFYDNEADVLIEFMYEAGHEDSVKSLILL